MAGRSPDTEPRFTDRPLRALGQEEPERILALLRLAVPDLLPVRVRVTPADVDDPHVSDGPHERVADFVIRLGSRLVVHVEFQGYRDERFQWRLFFYNTGLLKRYRGRTVRTVALWTQRPTAREKRNQVRVGSVIVKVTSIVLADLSAELLLRDTRAVCFAIGADPSGWSVEVLCQRIVEVMVRTQASDGAWRVARVVAAAAGRYKEFDDAMHKARVKPPLTDDLVRYGIDVGYRRGRRRGLKRGLEQGMEQGLQQGLQQGMEQGLQQGMEQGLQQGMEQGLRRALLATYEARFGKTPRAVIAAVEAMRDQGTLLGWQAVFATETARAIAATVGAGGRGRRG